MKTQTILLTTPLIRGETSITEITIRKPNVTALKGLKLLELMQSDVNSLITLLPRVSQPMLTKADIEKLDVGDLLKLSTAIFELMELTEDSEGKEE